MGTDSVTSDAATPPTDATIFRREGIGGGAAAGGSSGSGGMGAGGTGSGGSSNGAGGEIGGGPGTGGGVAGGTGGSVSGTGGGFVGGTGGSFTGTGGSVTGTGGTIIGTGGSFTGTGGIGTGGMITGTGGTITGTGGMGTGGTITGTGGMITGTGGMVTGTGGKTTVGCNSNSCPNGCCAGQVCVPSPTAQQCGHAGSSCQMCDPCERCSTAGACELDPTSQWAMTAASAVLNKNDPNDPKGMGPWDEPGELFGGSQPDPFCQFELPVGNPISATNSLVDTLMPNWKESLLLPGTTVTASDLLAGGQNWQIWVGDDDGPDTTGDELGEVMCEINAPLDAASFKAGGFTRTNVGTADSTAPSCTSVTITLTCQP